MNGTMLNISDLLTRKNLHCSSLFWVFTQRMFAVVYRYFGIDRLSRNVGKQPSTYAA